MGKRFDDAVGEGKATFERDAQNGLHTAEGDQCRT